MFRGTQASGVRRAEVRRVQVGRREERNNNRSRSRVRTLPPPTGAAGILGPFRMRDVGDEDIEDTGFLPHVDAVRSHTIDVIKPVQPLTTVIERPIISRMKHEKRRGPLDSFPGRVIESGVAAQLPVPPDLDALQATLILEQVFQVVVESFDPALGALYRGIFGVAEADENVVVVVFAMGHVWQSNCLFLPPHRNFSAVCPRRQSLGLVGFRPGTVGLAPDQQTLSGVVVSYDAIRQLCRTTGPSDGAGKRGVIPTTARKFSTLEAVEKETDFVGGYGWIRTTDISIMSAAL